MSIHDNQRAPFFAERGRDEAIFKALDALRPDGATEIDWREAVRQADAAAGKDSPPSTMALARCWLRNKASRRR